MACLILSFCKDEMLPLLALVRSGFHSTTPDPVSFLLSFTQVWLESGRGYWRQRGPDACPQKNAIALSMGAIAY